MIAAAFTEKSVEALFEAGLAQIPTDSTYAAVVRAVLEQHAKDPNDWRACRDILGREWGYDRYPGVCHIIPNAGITAMGMAYGAGDLCRTVEIATMGAWDTDCNAGNAGAVIGTFEGVQKSWDKYRGPINDMFVASGVIGALNIVDVPTFARELATLALEIDGQSPPDIWKEDMSRRGVRFDFGLPGATHGIRTAETNLLKLEWSDKAGPSGTPGVLSAQLARWERGEHGRVFWKPFYRREDFDDERYQPMFSPLAASGQKVRFSLWLDQWDGDGNIRIVPYVRRAMSGEIDEIGGWDQLAPDTWSEIEFTLPDCGGEAIDEIGFRAEYFGRLKFYANIYLADFEISGPGQTVIDPGQEVEEWGAISRFTWNRGYWKLEDDRITGLTASDADLWTGHLYTRDATVRATLRPETGSSHLVTARVQGTGRFYAAGFSDGRAVILREDFGKDVLAETPFDLVEGRDYDIAFHVDGDRLALTIDGDDILTAADDRFKNGQAGIRMAGPGRLSVARFEILER